MKTIIKSIIWIMLSGLFSCEKETNIRFHLDAINSNKYYSEEIISTDYQMIYGQWKLYKVTGGFHGTGYAPDYDYLEIKSVGIYGLIRNDSIFESGKIEVDTFDVNTDGYLQIRFVPDYYIGQYPYNYPSEKYIDLIGNDSLELISPCCDMYDYHYKRIK